jgi:hypothetical protein
MSWAEKITNTLFGRRIGLQQFTTNVSGSGRPGTFDVIVGAEATRAGVSTADTTATNLTAYGVSFISSASSSGVFTLDPPIPGVNKVIHFGTTGATNYVKTANSETFQSTQGTSATTIKSTQNNVGSVFLVGLTTALWGVAPGLSTASFALTTST